MRSRDAAAGGEASPTARVIAAVIDAGVPVSPGDVVVADGNGVVVVPIGEATAVLSKAKRLLANECIISGQDPGRCHDRRTDHRR